MRKPLFLTFLLILTVTACDQGKDNDAKQKDEGFSLSVPESERTKSKYCGLVTPATPEDPTPPYLFDPAFISEKLSGEGLVGWMHGVVPRYNHYIFTYRLEEDDFMAFFKAQQFTVIPSTPEVRGLLPTLHRHDKVRLKGSFFSNGSPLPHLKVTSIEVIETYKNATENGYEFDMATLKGQKKVEVFGQIHARVFSDKLGYGIVVEHKDAMLPVAVDPAHADVAANLFRNDIVNVRLKVVETPHSPPHFMTDGDFKDAIQVVDPMLNCHGLDRTVEGFLIKFTKSPAIISDTYGVRVIDANGIARNYTFFPGDHGDGMLALHKAIAAKAKEAWNNSPETEIVVRNFFKKEGIKVKVSGRLNVESPDQANPQVYINDVKDLTFNPQ